MAETTIRMPDTSKLIVSSSPHFHSTTNVRQIMLLVVLALLPGCAMGIWYFGVPALEVLFTCTFSCMAFEAISARLMKRPLELNDGSAAVTGLLLGMNMPSTAPLWVCIIGAFLAIVFGKMVYGGIGCNPFNPALVGRVGLLIAFPKVMTTFAPCVSSTVEATSSATVHAIATATPLTQLSLGTLPQEIDYMNLFLGRGLAGSLGETCSLALLIGGILLICTNLIRWHVPLFYFATVIICTGIPWLIDPVAYRDPLFHLLTGGLFLGAFFMATDMVTTPLSRTGAVIFAIGCGIITSAIRLWGSYPEGVSFSILIMNSLTPLIDRYTAGKPFGTPKKRGLKL